MNDAVKWKPVEPRPACFVKPWARDCVNCPVKFCDYKEQNHEIGGD